MDDSYIAKGLRNRLVEEIKLKGIRDIDVLEAIRSVPRHLFMDSTFMKHAYVDKAFPIGAEQTISQPYTVAFQTELLKVNSTNKVLEIGTGSGYQAAVLLEMGAKVFSIERHKELHIKAQASLLKMGYRPRCFFGDGYEGLPSYGPFDRIIITAAAPYVPEILLKQLKTGGRMVLPLGDNTQQNMILIEKVSETEFKKTTHGAFIFVPLLKGKVGK